MCQGKKFEQKLLFNQVELTVELIRVGANIFVYTKQF
jgi:hypothetical protein